MNLKNIEYWISTSMHEAQASLENGEVPVGCIFIVAQSNLEELFPSTLELPGNNTPCSEESGNYVMIAKGKNEVNATKNATRHAEMICIDQIVRKYNIKEQDAYLEEKEKPDGVAEQQNLDEKHSPNEVVQQGIQEEKQQHIVQQKQIPIAKRQQQKQHPYRKLFENLVIIVNVEPCIMCMAALLDLNVKTILFTCLNDRFGYNILNTASDANYIDISEIAEDIAEEIDTGDGIGKETVAKKVDRKIGGEETIEDIIDVKDESGEHVTETNKPVVMEHQICIEKTAQKSDTYEAKEIEANDSNIKKRMSTRIAQVEYMSEHIPEGKAVKYKICYNGKQDIVSDTSENVFSTIRHLVNGKDTWYIGDNTCPIESIVDETSGSFSGEENITRPRAGSLEPRHTSCTLGQSEGSALDHSVERSTLCNVIHYRKYEAETLNILKLFYKGVNPNAPKHKVKIKK